MASAPLRSLAALAICGRYATTRRLLHSVNAASVMSAIVIPRGHPHWPETIGRLPVANNLGGQDCFGRTHQLRKVSTPLRSWHGLSASADGESARYFGLSAEFTNIRPLGPVP